MSEKFKITEAAGEEIELLFKSPEYEDIEEADRVYAAKVASLVRESSKRKLLVRAELDSFLKNTGVWTDEDEDKVTSTQVQIASLLEKLRKGGIKLSEGRELAIKVLELRQDIAVIMRKRQIFDDSTIESLADNERTDYLIYRCTVYSDTGDRYWESFDDMKTDKLHEVYKRAYSVGAKILFGVDIEFEKNLPETKWLQKHGFVDDKFTFIDRKTKEPVDRNGKPVKELEEEMRRRTENLTGEIVEETPYIED